MFARVKVPSKPFLWFEKKFLGVSLLRNRKPTISPPVMSLKDGMLGLALAWLI
jgi:hypothetical protein